jgi:predicted amidohydrolase
MKAAICQYPIDFLPSFEAWQQKLSGLCATAADAEAGLLVFPEYAAMELTALQPESVRASLHDSIAALQPCRDAFLAHHRDLASQHKVTILAGSFPWLQPDGTFTNRAWLCTPDGQTRFQDKIQMTRFERELWSIRGGRELRTFDIPGARVGILICYDSEFPLLARRLCEAGATILLVPSCTDTPAGYHRVMLSCRARALEQQCFVLQAPTAGSAPWSPALDVNTGQAAAFGPVDAGFPHDGILAITDPSSPHPWLFADLPLARIPTVRRRGQVTNFHDWPTHEGIPCLSPETIPPPAS